MQEVPFPAPAEADDPKLLAVSLRSIPTHTITSAVPVSEFPSLSAKPRGLAPTESSWLSSPIISSPIVAPDAPAPVSISAAAPQGSAKPSSTYTPSWGGGSGSGGTSVGIAGRSVGASMGASLYTGSSLSSQFATPTRPTRAGPPSQSPIDASMIPQPSPPVQARSAVRGPSTFISYQPDDDMPAAATATGASSRASSSGSGAGIGVLSPANPNARHRTLRVAQ